MTLFIHSSNSREYETDLNWEADRTDDPRIQQIQANEPRDWVWREPFQPIRRAVELPIWVASALKSDKDGEIETAIDIVYDEVDQLLTAGRFEIVDTLLRRSPFGGESLTFLMCLLSITLPASRNLPSRSAYFNRVWNIAVGLKRNPQELLGGLRQWSRIDGSGICGEK